MRMNKFFFIIVILFLCFGCAENDQDLSAIKDHNPVQQKNAINSVIDNETTGAASELFALLSDNSRDKEVRLLAIKAVEDLEAEGAAEALIRLLAIESDNEILKAAIESLGKLQVVEAVPVLSKMLQPEPGNLILSEDVELEIIWALGFIGDKAAVPVLSGLLNAEDEFIRYNAYQALSQIANQD